MINKRNLAWIQVAIATILVLLVVVGLSKAKFLISMLLLFIIFLELLRTITTYFNEGIRVSLKYLVDGAFVFMLREELFIFSDPIYTYDEKVKYTVLIFGIMSFLLFFRYMLFKTSSDRLNSNLE